MALQKSRISQIEALTYDILADAYGKGKDIIPPINLANVLRQYNIQLKDGDFPDDNIAGAFDRKKRTIYMAKSDPYPRQAFTVAHELGHYFLHEGKQKDVFLRKQALEPEADGIEEQEANWFAASMLMPKELLLRFWQILGGDVDKVAESFNVSHIAAWWRAKNLGLL